MNEMYELMKWIAETATSEEGRELIGLIGDLRFWFECSKEAFRGVKEWRASRKAKEVETEEE